MLTSQQRSRLRSMANGLQPIFQVGKAGVNPELVQQLSDCLESRELIKVRVLQNCLDDPREVAQGLADPIQAEVVQVVGKVITLFRPSQKNPQIQI